MNVTLRLTTYKKNTVRGIMDSKMKLRMFEMTIRDTSANPIARLKENLALLSAYLIAASTLCLINTG